MSFESSSHSVKLRAGSSIDLPLISQYLSLKSDAGHVQLNIFEQLHNTIASLNKTHQRRKATMQNNVVQGTASMWLGYST